MNKKTNIKNNLHNNRYNTVFDFARRHKFIVSVVAVSFVVLGVIVTVSLNQYISHSQDRQNAERMVEVMGNLKTKLADADLRQVWSDNSHCTIVKPRLFSDTSTHTCTSQYDTSIPVTSQDEIDSKIRSYQNIIENDVDIYDVDVSRAYPIFTTDIYILNKPTYDKVNQVGSVGFRIKDVEKRGACASNYELTAASSSSVVLNIRFECTVDTAKAYFEPIHEI